MELAHLIMELRKSHSLSSAIWRPREAGGVVLIHVQRPENKECRWCKTHVPAQVVRQRESSPFLCLFVLFGFSMSWMRSTHTGEGDLLYWFYQCECEFFPGKTRTQPEIMLNETAGNPVAQWSWHVKLTITTSFAETTPGAVFLRMVLAVLSEMANNWRFESH